MKSSNKLYKAKQKRNKRSVYDRSQIDIAVDMVMKNKLSLRAASHIYKIPFSTLRTRKIFLEEHPDEELNLTSSSTGLTGGNLNTSQSYSSGNSNGDDDASDNDNDRDDEDDNDDDQEDDQEANDDDVGVNEDNEDDNDSLNNSNSSSSENNNNMHNTSSANNRLSLQEMREKPLTLHNMKNANLASAKTEALIASLGLKPNSLELKKSLINTKKTFIKKPIKKRLKGGLKFLNFKEKQKQKYLASGGASTATKKISKATLKNNEIILSSINAKREVEQQTGLQQLGENNKYMLRDCRFFKCKECKLIFIDLKQLLEHQVDHEYQKPVTLVHDDRADKLANLSAYVDKQEVFKCSFCKHVYLNKYSFLSHTMLCNGVNNLV